MGTQTETRRTDWYAFPHYDIAAYRIWKRINGRNVEQRHEWRLQDGSVRMDDWIQSSGPFAKNMGPITEMEAPRK